MMPPIRSSGISTATSDTLIDTMVKPISLAPLNAAASGLSPVLDIARDVLQHHDGVVDDEADGDRQRHQRQIVEGIAERPHQRAGAEQRQRHRHAGMTVAQKLRRKTKITITTSSDGDQERDLHVLDRGADGQGTVADDLDLDRRRNRRDQPRQLRLDPVDGFDDVGAGLLEDDEEHAALAVGPGGLLHVLGPGNGLADVADPQRTAVAIGDDDVVPVLGVQ